MGLNGFCVSALAAALWQNDSPLCKYFLKKLTEQVADSLHSFQNDRQVGLLLLPTVPHLQCNTSKIPGI